MHEFFNEPPPEEQEDLLDLNEVMQGFGIDEWTNLGAVESSHAENLSLLVDVQGQRYVLRERPEGLMGEDPQHRYAFQRYLQQAGIPVPALRSTLQGESVVTLGEDAFELQEWVAGEHFSTADKRSLKWVESAGTMLGRIHLASRHYRGHQHTWPAEAQIGAVVQSYLNLARS
ncbi:MAG TPA: phosphotransferase, partial [Ktedonobacteraceae bacterium]